MEILVGLVLGAFAVVAVVALPLLALRRGLAPEISRAWHLHPERRRRVVVRFAVSVVIWIAGAALVLLHAFG
jgi:O-antigen/teichoic acid export membrane protein